MNAKGTILIVDDEPDVRAVLEEYFVAHGYAALCAESASAARLLVAKHPIDLALVDIHMPGEDGLSLARHLRERYAKLAIVMLTSAGTVVDRIVASRWVPTTTSRSPSTRGSWWRVSKAYCVERRPRDGPTLVRQKCASGDACSISLHTG